MNKQIHLDVRMSISAKKLLEYLFEEGLSSKTESVIEGLSKFFKDLDQSNLPLVKSLGNCLVECLNTPKYKIVEVAAVVLRNYINSVYGIPSNCVHNLIMVLDKTVPSSARQAALTLGCIGCTKPSISSLLALGIWPIHEVDRDLCFGCQGGFFRGENAEYFVPILIKNLNLPISRDRSREVRWGCAIALGEIGYTMPDAVFDSLESLRICLKERDSRDGSIRSVKHGECKDSAFFDHRRSNNNAVDRSDPKYPADRCFSLWISICLAYSAGNSSTILSVESKHIKLGR